MKTPLKSYRATFTGRPVYHGRKPGPVYELIAECYGRTQFHAHFDLYRNWVVCSDPVFELIGELGDDDTFELRRLTGWEQSWTYVWGPVEQHCPEVVTMERAREVDARARAQRKLVIGDGGLDGPLWRFIEPLLTGPEVAYILREAIRYESREDKYNHVPGQLSIDRMIGWSIPFTFNTIGFGGNA